jgi:hypothetical protein
MLPEISRRKYIIWNKMYLSRLFELSGVVGARFLLLVLSISMFGEIGEADSGFRNDRNRLTQRT